MIDSAGKLPLPPTLPEAGEFAKRVKRAFAAFLQRADYPCLGAKATIAGHACDLQCYGKFGENVFALAHDLYRFLESPLRQRSNFASFVAVFREPTNMTEAKFEKRLWRVLQRLDEIDRTKFAWDESVSADPARADFAFSFGGTAFYIVGLHKNSSRFARRFAWPALVFNAHEQFRKLRVNGKWDRMKRTIRKRDFALQGSINPMLDDFGERSEARQYSGRAVESDWTAPFQGKKDKAALRCPFSRG